MQQRRLCCVSIDLDEIPNYHAIHGLPSPSAATSTLVYDLALERFRAWSSAHALPLTLFAIGADLERGTSAAVLRDLAAAGHEIACHSYHHFYDLTRRSERELRFEVEEGIAAITRAVGVRPVGFRAPGYTVSDALFRVLSQAGLEYDSSVFPCPAYYAAKAAARATLALRGAASRSVLDTPRVLSAPTRPYRVGVPYYRRGSGLLELPIQVTRRLRLPFIGTALTLVRPAGVPWLTRGVLGEPLVNLELHGIDALDTADGLSALTRHQPDVHIPHATKLAALSAAVEFLREAGYTFVCLRDAARFF